MLASKTSKPVVTLVYSRKPRKTKSTDPVSKSKIIKSANNKEPSYLNCSLVFGLRLLQAYDRRSLLLTNFVQLRVLRSCQLQVMCCGKIMWQENNGLCRTIKMVMLYDIKGLLRGRTWTQFILRQILNGKEVHTVIVDDYSRFTWVKCLRSKDEALDFIIRLYVSHEHLLLALLQGKWRLESAIVSLLKQPTQLIMQEDLNEFERLEVCELVPRPDKVMVITLKRIYKVKLDELGGILKNKACLSCSMERAWGK
ncbi:hypothetical protein Tco_0941948 [Tanacetum coccineum]|uniref:Uncharacterized protein n=1 Tax=Tanacetum coccineum TaxID=301880 RepID=A0ABQ5DT75_9ASTR